MKSDLVHIVDDDAGVRHSLRLLLRSYGYRVLAWPNAATFLANIQSDEPACAVIDLDMPGMSGIELQERLNELGLPLATIMLSGHADVSTAVSALRLGALNFMEKPADPQLLLLAIGDALETLYSRRIVEIQRIEAIELLGRLSPRELEVLRAVANGQQNKMIAIELGISPRTVEVYRANIMEKLDCQSLAGILKIAFRAGLLDPPPDLRPDPRPRFEPMRDSA